LQNLLKSEKSRFNLKILSFLVLALLLSILFTSFRIIRKKTVRFKAEDGVTITANHYFSKKSSPYILLLHQEQSSRGEFDSIADRFTKMNYNCLAIDLRSGYKHGFIENETAKDIIKSGKTVNILESLKDIKAAIEYSWNLSGEEIILFGSGSSASLALIEGKDNKHVKAVIAFSPGEYFKPAIDMKTFLTGYPKSVYVGTSDQEFNYIQDMFSGMDGKNKIIFRPNFGPGSRGTSALLRSNPTRDEYWLSLLIYFKSLK
jgi:dienelactone hydrolase